MGAIGGIAAPQWAHCVAVFSTGALQRKQIFMLTLSDSREEVADIYRNLEKDCYSAPKSPRNRSILKK